MVHVVRMQSESTPIASTVASARNNIENFICQDQNYANILNDLVESIPTLKAFLGFDVMAKRAKLKSKKRKTDELSSMKPLTEGIVKDEEHDTTVHHTAILCHPEWP